jgi:hypothetical protein
MTSPPERIQNSASAKRWTMAMTDPPRLDQ